MVYWQFVTNVHVVSLQVSSSSKAFHVVGQIASSDVKSLFVRVYRKTFIHVVGNGEFFMGF
jgi:hypothetical protein